MNKLTIEEVIKKGRESKKDLQDYLKNNQCIVSYISYGKDRYNRELGTLYCNEINLNKYMIKNCGCLQYEYNGK